jgi:hypothetical protein
MMTGRTASAAAFGALLLAGGGIFAALRLAPAPASPAPDALFGPSRLSATPFGAPQPAANKPALAQPPAATAAAPGAQSVAPQFPQPEQTADDHPPQPLYAFA